MENAHIVVSDLIVLVLCPSLPFKCVFIDVSELLVTRLHRCLANTCLKMTVGENKRCVLELESDADCSFIASGVSEAGLDFTTRYIENPGLDRFFSDQHDIQSKHVLLSANLILVRDSVLVEIFENQRLEQLYICLILPKRHNPRGLQGNNLLEAYD